MSGSTTISQERYKLVFFVPVPDAEIVKEAVWATGAGTIGLYDKTCFSCPGLSQFTPNEHASPYIGAPGKAERVDEVRCEIQCRGREQVQKAVEAVKA